MDSAMDLSLRNSASSPPSQVGNPIMSPSPSLPKIQVSGPAAQIVRPIPRPPWSIVWYQNLWSISTSPEQITGSESGFNGKSENSGTKLVLRSNERSSFSVLNNLSTNTVNNCIDNNCNNFSYAPSGEQHFQHQQYQYPSEECYTATSATEPMSLAQSSSFFSPKQFKNTEVDLQRQQNFSTSQKKSSRNDYSSDNDSDSDNSENIVVTTTSSYRSGFGSDSIIKSSSSCSLDKPDLAESLADGNHLRHQHQPHQTTVILDIACCDGPVQFKRISNPNFALTVEHNEVCPPSSFPVDDRKSTLSTTPSGIEGRQQQRHHENHESEPTERNSFSSDSAIAEGAPRFHLPHHANSVEDGGRDLNSADDASASASTTVTTHKSYLCIYCNQSFKSLFCYQKHKKRHLNPVSVDITTTTPNSTSYRGGSGGGTSSKKANVSGGVSTGGNGVGDGGGGGGGIIGIIPENAKAKTKDLNVQFFPCKKCGCKFPSYYFVHKHRKICH